MAKIKEQLDMFKGSDAAYEDALENMKKTRKLVAERTKEVDKTDKINYDEDLFRI